MNYSIGSKRELKEQIEMKRVELNKLAEQVGIQTMELLEISRELDQLLNDYAQVVKRKGDGDIRIERPS